MLTLVIATAYVMVGALRVTPFDSAYRVTIQLPESGGLLPNQDVTLRGVPIGRVQSLAITPDGVAAVATRAFGCPDPDGEPGAGVGAVPGR